MEKRVFSAHVSNSNLCLLRQKIKGKNKRVFYLNLDLEEELETQVLLSECVGEKEEKEL